MYASLVNMDGWNNVHVDLMKSKKNGIGSWYVVQLPLRHTINCHFHFSIFFLNMWHLNVSIVSGGTSFLLNRLEQLFRTFIEYSKTWIIYFHRLMNEHHSFCLFVSMSMVISLNLMAPAATNNNHRAISLPNHFKWDTIETNAVLALQLNELNNSQTHSLTAERIPCHSGHLTNTCFFQSNHQITSNPKHHIQNTSRRAMDIWIDKC